MITHGKWKVSPNNPVRVISEDGASVASTGIPQITTFSKDNARAITAIPDFLDSSRDFLGGWSHFCKCIDFGKSNLDADAIRFMNEVPGKIQQAFAKATKTI